MHPAMLSRYHHKPFHAPWHLHLRQSKSPASVSPSVTRTGCRPRISFPWNPPSISDSPMPHAPAHVAADGAAPAPAGAAAVPRAKACVRARAGSDRACALALAGLVAFTNIPAAETFLKHPPPPLPGAEGRLSHSRLVKVMFLGCWGEPRGGFPPQKVNTRKYHPAYSLSLEGTPPPPSRAPSLCPATVSLTASASLNGICNRL